MARGTRRHPAARRQHQAVLNASRHHGKGDLPAHVLEDRPGEGCSTPLGITARGTRRGSRAPTRRACAQRLSASRQGGRANPNGILPPSQGAQRLSASRQGGLKVHPLNASSSACSTPLGITARGTRPGPARARRRPAVLNASRHHGKGGPDEPERLRGPQFVLNASRHHGKGDRTRIRAARLIRGRAQRLSASRQGGPRPLTPNRGPRCAQRLSASPQGGLFAYRHHDTQLKCSTPLGITARGTSARSRHAPNPTCAQRLSASRQGGRYTRTNPQESNTCSTPLGITARGTTPKAGRRRLPARAQRLSASRQGGLHQKTLRAPANLCSTPLGITARGTHGCL